VTGEVRRRMIRQMALLLAEKGLQRASFSEVLEASGAPRGSLYHHFPGGKDELVVAAIASAGQYVLTALDRLVGRPAPEVAKGFIAIWRAVLEQSALQVGCAIVAVTAAAESPRLRDEAGEIFKKWRERLADALAAGGVSKTRAPALSAGLIAACEGAVALARAERSFEPFDLMAEEQLATIEAAVPRRRRAPARRRSAD
jgi:TetR/AcrR family transcriptional regulator, lmrAB and yxaGH operons repressor